MNRVQRFSKLVLGMLCLAGALPVHATFLGRNGRIAFVQGPDIFVMNPDGSDVRHDAPHVRACVAACYDGGRAAEANGPDA